MSALGDLGVELLDEIEAGLDGIHVDEQFTAREGLGETIVKSASTPGPLADNL
jgi:hypothetical protein